MARFSSPLEIAGVSERSAQVHCRGEAATVCRTTKPCVKKKRRNIWKS